MTASQAWGVLGRGACPHTSAHTASLLTLDVLKHLKGDAFVGGKSHLWLGRGDLCIACLNGALHAWCSQHTPFSVHLLSMQTGDCNSCLITLTA